MQYKQAAIPTESVSGDLFNYEGCPVELSARRTEKQSSEDNTMCFSGTPGTPVVPLHKSPVRSKIDERKRKLRQLYELFSQTSANYFQSDSLFFFSIVFRPAGGNFFLLLF